MKKLIILLISGSSAAAHARVAPAAARRVTSHATARQSAPDGVEFASRFGSATFSTNNGSSTERSAGPDETTEFVYTARVPQSGHHKFGVGGRVLQ